MKQMAFYGGFKGFGKGKARGVFFWATVTSGVTDLQGFFKGKGPRVDPSEKVWIGGIACLA